MQFRVLGPLEADHRGEPIDLGSPKQREVLSFLLMHAGRSVSADRILDAVWGDTDGQNPLYIAVSRLRSAFAEAGNGEVLTTQSKAYTLEVEVEALDAVRFEALIERAADARVVDPEGARADLETALELWRGPAWEEVRYRDFALAEAERLEELRAGAVESLLDLRLAAGETNGVVADARAHHESHPLRERPVELLMVALYRSGRQAEALRAYSAFAATLSDELGVDPSPHLQSVEERILLHDPAVQTRERRRARASNPFMGLRAFEERDADLFFGRDRLIGETLERLRSGETLVTLVGASGSGKSSIVRAGVLPAVRRGDLTGTEDWLVATMVPGAHPFAEFEAAMIQASGDVRVGRVGSEDTSILGAALAACGPERRLLLLVDQFEELFTLTEGEADRSAFLHALGLAVDDPRGRMVAVLTLRADHYELPLEYPLFADRFGRGVVNVGPLLPAELEMAIVEPAGRADLEVEPALLATIVADVAGQAGALPLFQYTLAHLADRGESSLTAEAYAEAGGVAGALTREADNVFAGLSLDEQDACRQLFLRMVAPGSEASWTRRRLPLAEARSLGAEPGVLESVISSLVSARLLTTDRSIVDGVPTIEVAHESLLVEWQRLAEWLNEARNDIERHAVLADAAGQWGHAQEDASYLWKGRRLSDAVAWAGISTVELTDEEDRFLREAMTAEQAEQLSRERAARARRRRTWGLAVALVGLVALGGLAAWQWLTPAPTEVLVLDATRDDAVSALFVDGLTEVEDRLGLVGLTVRPGVDTGSEIEAAVQGGASNIVVARDAPRAFPPSYWDDLSGRVVGSHFFDFAFTPVGPREHPSWTRVEFKENEGAFLVGAVAAMRSQTGVVGFVGANSGYLQGARAGFEAGAAFVDPSVRVVSAVTPVAGHPWDAYASEAAGRAYDTTWALLDEGADVIFHTHGDAGTGVIEAVVAANSIRPTWFIGHEYDTFAALQGSDPQAAARVLTSVVRRYDRALFLAIERSRAEKTAYVDVGIADGGLEVAEGGALTEAEADLVADLVGGVGSGAIGEGRDGPAAEILRTPVLPEEAPTHVPDGALVIEAAVRAGTFEIGSPPPQVDLGDVVVLRASRDQLTQSDLAFVAIGRLPPGADPLYAPESLVGPAWAQDRLFDVGIPRDWAFVPTRGSAAASVVVDQPGTWAAGIGFVDFLGDGEPVEWVFFEVEG